MLDVNLINKRNNLGKSIPELKRQYVETKDESIFNELLKVRKEYQDLLFEVYTLENVNFALELLGDKSHVVHNDVLIERTENFIMLRSLIDETEIERYNKKYNK